MNETINENEATVDGVAYVAADAIKGAEACAGCAGLDDDALCGALPPCRAKARADGRMVRFVRKEDATHA